MPLPRFTPLFAISCMLFTTIFAFRNSNMLINREKRFFLSLSSTQTRNGLGVVITGGTKGVGFALAKEFLSRGDRVVVCGRNRENLDQAVTKLNELFPGRETYGITCDVSNYEDVEKFAKYAKAKLEDINIWINNAGSVAYKRRPLLDLQPGDIEEVISTNLLGSMYCCKAAINVMKSQAVTGHIFNMDGAGVGGNPTDGYAAYGATKRAMPQLTSSLSKELQNMKISNVGVHNLSPGMVITDLLLSDSTPIIRRFFNVLAEEPDTVASNLVPRIKEIQGTGGYIRFLTIPDALIRIVTGFPQIFFGGKFFDSAGNRIKQPGVTYNENGVKLEY